LGTMTALHMAEHRRRGRRHLRKRAVVALPNLALRKLAFDIFSVATTIDVLHAARLFCRWLRWLLMQCTGKPAHEFFGEDST
jgi:hypothetical protein